MMTNVALGFGTQQLILMTTSEGLVALGVTQVIATGMCQP